ncbi:MAG TPA: hypothetical protein O0X19_02025 [Methanocorpusculum sp.]|nr:hypothetical protein [Candidatus Methanocorpusculum equi]MCQ2357748.1 hypothetical protein [Methanocorpusculum sp.]HJJ33145.1 hypothetical protein [Methanocorpusculum sp.]HJJ44484.1 hypothetical protein [Methanocorpusculum sp.]
MVKTANPTAPAHNVMLCAESGEKEDFFALSSSPALYSSSAAERGASPSMPFI